jgi:radical SAM protein with 4Fe4S-binding SPASM domain
MGFLRLHPECRLVEGARNICLYDCLGGSLASLHRVESDFVREALGSKPMEELLQARTPDERQKIEDCLTKLKERDLGGEYDRPYYIKAIERGSGPGFISFFEPTRVRVLFLELTQECPLDCLYCHVPDVFGRGTGCGRYGDLGGPPLAPERRRAILRQAVDLGAGELHLIGGDVLLAPNWEEVLEEALALGLALVTVWTSGFTPLPDRWAGDPRVRFAFLVYSHHPEVHDEVAGRPGAHAALMTNLELLKTAGGSPFISLVVTSRAEDHWSEAETFYKPYTRLPPRVIPLFPTGDGALTPTGAGRTLLSARRWFMRVDPRLLSMTQDYHTCFAGKLAITADGRVLACPGGRKWVLGDAKTENLWAILSAGRHKPYWARAKTRLDKCGRCEFRLACFDCRLIQGRGESLTSVDFCDYDPDRGEWRSTVAGG